MEYSSPVSWYVFFLFFYFNIAAIAFCFLTKRPQSTIVRNGSSNLHRVFLTSHTGCQYWIINAQYSRNNWQLCTLSVIIIFLTDICSFCWQKCGRGPKLFYRLDIFSTFRGVHTLIFTCTSYYIAYIKDRRIFIRKAKRCFRDWPFTNFLVVLSFICLTVTKRLPCESQTSLAL